MLERRLRARVTLDRWSTSPTWSPSTSGARRRWRIGDRVVRSGIVKSAGHRPGGRRLDRPGRRRAGRPRQPRRSVQGGLRLRPRGRRHGGSSRSAARSSPASFGENLTLAGVDVTGARIGERWRIGSAEFEVSGPRVPCSKLGARMGDPRFPSASSLAGRPGAYLSVVAPGTRAGRRRGRRGGSARPRRHRRPGLRDRAARPRTAGRARPGPRRHEPRAAEPGSTAPRSRCAAYPA